jgi:hypothetical protein
MLSGQIMVFEFSAIIFLSDTIMLHPNGYYLYRMCTQFLPLYGQIIFLGAQMELVIYSDNRDGNIIFASVSLPLV